MGDISIFPWQTETNMGASKETMKKDLCIRSYENGDSHELRKLYHLVFGIEVSEERWKWRYEKNPSGHIGIFVGVENDRIIAQSALMPLRMKIGDGIKLGALTIDSMTHPDYRGQGLYVKLDKYSFPELAKKGFPVIYGFPNKNMHPIRVKWLNWVDLSETLPIFVKPLNIPKILAHWICSRLLLAISGTVCEGVKRLMYLGKERALPPNSFIKKISVFDKRVDILWEKASSQHTIAVLRDSKYLNWRYIENPDNDYTVFIVEKSKDILGYIILRCMKKFDLQMGLIMDIFTLPEHQEVSHNLIFRGIQFFQEKKADVISCLMLRHSPYCQNLIKNGFFVLPSKLFPQEMHLGACLNSSEYPKDFVTNSKNWFITWGDHDGI